MPLIIALSSVILVALGAAGLAFAKSFGTESGKTAAAGIGKSLSATQPEVPLDGTWHAIWETTAMGNPNINSEILEIVQDGASLVIRNVAPSAENKAGGYLWQATCHIDHRQYICGTYKAIERHVQALGTLYLRLNASGMFMVGRWVGCNIDHEISTGWVVVARDKPTAAQMMTRLTDQSVELSIASGDPKRLLT